MLIASKPLKFFIGSRCPVCRLLANYLLIVTILLIIINSDLVDVFLPVLRRSRAATASVRPRRSDRLHCSDCLRGWTTATRPSLAQPPSCLHRWTIPSLTYSISSCVYVYLINSWVSYLIIACRASLFCLILKKRLYVDFNFCTDVHQQIQKQTNKQCLQDSTPSSGWNMKLFSAVRRFGSLGPGTS